MAAAAITPEVEQVALGSAPCWPLPGPSPPGLAAAPCSSASTRHCGPLPFTLILLQLLRMVALVAVCLGWYRAIRWAADTTLNTATPNLVAWSAWVICLSLGIFVLWALLSWIFSIAPLLAMLEGTGVFRSLARSLRLGALTGKLVEVNLVLGIVRLALIVLAMVFSAIPLPFAADMTGTALYPLVGIGHPALPGGQRFLPGGQAGCLRPVLAALPSRQTPIAFRRKRPWRVRQCDFVV